MRVIVAGSRNILDYNIVKTAIEKSGFDITQVVSGCAQGVDKLGEAWAMGSNVPVARFPADWKKYGKSAGMIRNAKMAKNADALVAVWDGVSRGTKGMIDIATRDGLKVFVHTLDNLE